VSSQNLVGSGHLDLLLPESVFSVLGEQISPWGDVRAVIDTDDPVVGSDIVGGSDFEGLEANMLDGLGELGGLGECGGCSGCGGCGMVAIFLGKCSP